MHEVHKTKSTRDVQKSMIRKGKIIGGNMDFLIVHMPFSWFGSAFFKRTKQTLKQSLGGKVVWVT